MHFQVQHFGSVGTKVGSVGTKGFFGVCSGLVLIRKVSAANRNYDFGQNMLPISCHIRTAQTFGV